MLQREALVHLDRKRSTNRDQPAMFGELIADYQQRLDAMPAERERVEGFADQARRSAAILEVLHVERVALIRFWDEGQIDDDVLGRYSVSSTWRRAACTRARS